MAKISAAGRKPGPQRPDLYSSVGPNYQKYGEQDGYYYLPETDQYYIDQKKVQKDLENRGVIDPEPKPPGLAETLLPVAGAAGAIYAGKELGKKVTSGLFGAGSGGEAAATASSGASSGGGLFSAGSEVAQGPLTQTGNTLNSVGVGRDTAMSAGDAIEGKPGGLFSVGSTAGNVLGAGEIGLGGYEAFQGIKNKNPVQAGLGGLGVVTGINQLGYALGPWGVAASIALPAVIALASKMGDKDRWKEEGDRLKKLKEQGVFIPDGLLNNLPSKGRSKEELVALATQNGTPQDIKFAQSRDVNDLKGSGQSIIGYSTFAEKNPDWFKLPQDKQIAYANQLLDMGLVSEAKGQIKVDWSKAPPMPTLTGNQPTTGSTSTAPQEQAVNDIQASGPVPTTRSKTKSPGIDMNGNRINY